MELFISIFENSSAKGSFRSNKISYEILQLSADSRYLQSGPLKDATYIAAKRKPGKNSGLVGLEPWPVR